MCFYCQNLVSAEFLDSAKFEETYFFAGRRRKMSFFFKVAPVFVSKLSKQLSQKVTGIVLKHVANELLNSKLLH